ncbi:MAG: hypothetical protein ABFD60_01385 [Bryobacteraceae bacterium]
MTKRSDLTPTGEHQLRLPGDVGKVRDVEIPTPTLPLPRPSRKELISHLEIVLDALKKGWR